MSTLMEQTSEKETKQLHNNHNDEEIEIDLMDLLRKVIGIRKKIYKAAGIGLIIGIIVAISIPKQYTVEVTLSPDFFMKTPSVIIIWNFISYGSVISSIYQYFYWSAGFPFACRSLLVNAKVNFQVACYIIVCIGFQIN